MLELKEKILSDGEIIEPDILKVIIKLIQKLIDQLLKKLKEDLQGKKSIRF